MGEGDPKLLQFIKARLVVVSIFHQTTAYVYMGVAVECGCGLLYGCGWTVERGVWTVEGVEDGE